MEVNSKNSSPPGSGRFGRDERRDAAIISFPAYSLPARSMVSAASTLSSDFPLRFQMLDTLPDNLAQVQGG